MNVNKKILVADDNADLADSVATLLELEGYDVEVEYSGKAAINKLKKGGFDTAFVDIKMPEVSGFDVLRECKNDVVNKIILMTGFRIEQVIAEINNKKPAAVIKLKEYDHQAFEQVDADLNNQILVLTGDGDRIKECLNSYCAKRDYTVCELYKKSDCEDKKCDADIIIIYQKESLIESLLLLEMIFPDKQQHSKIVVVMDLPFKNGENEPSLYDYSVTGCFFKPVDPDAMLAILNQLD